MNRSSELTPEELASLGVTVDNKTVTPSSHFTPVFTQEVKEVSSATTDTLTDSNETETASQIDTGESSSPNKYAGDVKDDSPPLHNNQYEALSNFSDSAQIAEFFDEDINSGLVTLHRWQIEVSVDLCDKNPTSQHPHKFCLCACNGSGKDAYVIAPFVIWFALTKIQSLTIITSSSGVQLTAQTENYIKRLAEKVNAYFGEPYFKINQRYIKCLKTGSEIRMFATDEAGKAEGYHPLTPKGEMAIIVNEAKSVAPEIFGALKRCTGYNYWLNVSTPGEPFGDFYKSFTKWPHKRHVSTYDCPHLSVSEREEDRIEMGEHSPLFRSKHLALFTSLGGTVVISQETIEQMVDKATNGLIPKLYQDWPLRIGGDLAAGGDEIVLTGTKGNQITKRICFTQKDTTVTADIIEHHLIHTFKVSKSHEHIYMDDGGVGRGIIDILRRRGWNIVRVLNQSPAVKKKEFGNHGAEIWYRAKRIIEEGLFNLLIDGKRDKKFEEQLANRYYKQQSTQGRITLESKSDAKAHGRPSPDRADSFLLSLTGLTIDDFLSEEKHGPNVKLPNGRIGSERRGMTAEQLREHLEETVTYSKFNKQPQPLNKPLYGSLSAWLSSKNN